MTHTLQEVPHEIRSWLGSDGVTFYLIDLNNRLSLADFGMTLIPNLLYRLVIQDLPAQNFTTTLSEELELTPNSAKEIAKEIEKKVLDPVKRALLEWGVDITLIQIGDVVKDGVNVEEKITGSAPVPLAPKEGERVSPPPPPAGSAPRPLGSFGGGAQMTSFEDKLRGAGSQPAGGVRVVEQTPTAPSFTGSAPKIIESATPTLNTAPVRLTEEEKKAQLAEKLNAITKPIMPPGEPVVAKAPPKAVPIPPQEVKLTPGLLPTLKEEDGKIKLKEDAPFMLHKEEKLEPTLESKTFKSNIEFAPPKPAPKPITARVEIGDAGENKPKVVHYSEMRTELSPDVLGAAKPAASSPAPQPTAPSAAMKPPSADIAAKEPTAWKNATPAFSQSPAAAGGPALRLAPTPPPVSGLTMPAQNPVVSPVAKPEPKAPGNVVDLR